MKHVIAGLLLVIACGVGYIAWNSSQLRRAQVDGPNHKKWFPEHEMAQDCDLEKLCEERELHALEESLDKYVYMIWRDPILDGKYAGNRDHSLETRCNNSLEDLAKRAEKRDDKTQAAKVERIKEGFNKALNKKPTSKYGFDR